MRICFLAAGDSVHSLRWIRFFAEKGHEVHWISLVPQEHPPVPRVVYHAPARSKNKILNLGVAALAIRNLVERIAPDVLHAHYVGSYGLLGALSGFQPLVLTAWGSDILVAGGSAFKRPIIQRVLNSARLITCDAGHLADAMVRLGAPRENIRLIRFGVEVERFLPGGKDQDILRAWNATDSPVVISLRNLEPVYDVATLLDAVPHVIRHVPGTKFVIAGTGSQEAHLRQRALSLSVDDNVVFIGRFPNERLSSYLRSSDVYVSTALSDAGIAASTAEAMACGVPVVVTDSGENRRWVEDGVCGYVVPVRRAGLLAERILALLKDPGSRKAFAAAGRKIIEERNNYRREMERMQDCYAELSGRAA